MSKKKCSQILNVAYLINPRTDNITLLNFRRIILGRILKNHVALHTKIDLNLYLMKRTSTTVNLLNFFEMETY